MHQKNTGFKFIFLVPLKQPDGSIQINPICTMINHFTTQIFLNNLKIPEENLIGKEGEGFYYLLDGLNAERILIASECIGDSFWFIEKATKYAKERIVFDIPIGKNQGIQFPLAQVYANTKAAELMRNKAVEIFDAGLPCGEQANIAKLLSSQAAWEAANVCMNTFGGYGYCSDYDIERKFRETRLYITAPISNNMVLSYIAEHVLNLPRSY